MSAQLAAPEARVNSLTGLRFLAAFVVYLHHHPKPPYLPEWLATFFAAGYNGVTLFFVLSGFVLGLNYFDALARPNWRETLRFGIARLARVYPLYFIVLVYVWLQYGAPLENEFALHLLTIQAWSPDLGVAFGYNPPAWSVGVEIFLYACFPFLVLLLAPLRRRKGLLWLVALGIVIVLVGVALYFLVSGRGALPIEKPGSAHRWLYRTPLPRLGDFALGLIAALLFKERGTRPRFARAWAGITYAALGGIALLMFWPAHLLSVFSFDVSYAPLACLLILGLALAPQTLLSRFLGSRPLVILGEASYALYLIHLPLMRIFDIGHYLEFAAPVALCLWIAFGTICLTLSINLNQHVEAPARRALNAWATRVLQPRQQT